MHPSFDWKASLAAKIMNLGGVIAYPTEAVWGLGCDPFQQSAVERLLDLKSRPMDKGLILISGHKKHFEPFLEPLTDELKSRFFSHQERPTTWLVPDYAGQIPYWVKGKHQSVAMRLTRHPLCCSLSSHFDGLVVSTSANPASRPSASSLAEVKHYFHDQVDYCLQAPLGRSGAVSQIKDLVTDQVLRG